MCLLQVSLSKKRSIHHQLQGLVVKALLLFLVFFFRNIFRKLRQCNKDTQIRLKKEGRGGGAMIPFFFNWILYCFSTGGAMLHLTKRRSFHAELSYMYLSSTIWQLSWNHLTLFWYVYIMKSNLQSWLLKRLIDAIQCMKYQPNCYYANASFN